MKFLNEIDGADKLITDANNRLVKDTDINNWNNKSDKGHKHTKNEITDFPVSLPANGGNADTVNGKTVESNVPANAKFTDTTYSEISTSEIDAGTSSTLRTISGRRVKYILDKVQGWIGNLTKADVGLNNVDNVKQATKVEFDEHLADYALFKNGAFELWASRSTNTYKTIFDSPTAGDITEEIRNTISGDLVASKVTEFDTPTVGQISETLHVVEDNVTVTKITTFNPDGSISEMIT